MDVGRNSAAVIHRSHGLHAAIRSSDKLTGTIASDRLNLQDSDIPDLLTTKIIGGTFDVARIPSLSTAQITSGTFAASFIPTLSSLSGQVSSSQLSLDIVGVNNLPRSVTRPLWHWVTYHSRTVVHEKLSDQHTRCLPCRAHWAAQERQNQSS